MHNLSTEKYETLHPRQQSRDTIGHDMHQHNQTIADLERMQEPSALEIAAYAVALVAGTACVLLFAFTI
jgi:hypothetical protein